MTIIDAAPDVRPNSDGFTPIPNSHIASDEERGVAKQYAAWTTKYKFTNTEVYYEESETGEPYRFAGGVQMSYGTKTFIIFLKRGATEIDLSILHIVVDDVKAGLEKRYPWSSVESKKHPGTEFRSLTLGTAMTPDRFESIRPYNRRFIVKCTQEGCAAPYHLVEEDDPTAVFVLHKGTEKIEGAGYEIRLSKYADEPWKVSISGRGHDDLYLHPTVAASFVNDVAWLAAEARRLNIKLGF
ncbi:hypothetical protein LLS1_18790 [Leifsonia sp. LS1]|uniref:hypothetical protein n=1 Tax=Leifsonia sp. LS1 TaxID=2828483 RepID=UPI001CFC6308|nr:hypothetical protein [Leifsonia sp. LS1]GIT80210.1 hypothetical protein LLS1_18790 [Leifsonia sp. LS1]